jgi:pimeloyl-ACP methyl ester carboxylesterase
MRRTGGFRSQTDHDRYAEVYAEAMRQGPTPDQQLDLDTTFGATRVYRYGDGAGTVLLLSGMAGSAASMTPYAAALSRHRTVYTVDTIGEAGMSVQTTPLRDHADRARWLDEVMAGLDLTDVHLVGFSTGGFYAVHQAIHAPDRLASIILLDPTTVTVGFAPSTALLGLVASVINRDWLWRRWFRWAAGADVLDQPETRLALAAIRHFRPGIPPQLRPPARTIAAITVPVTAVFGGRSAAHDGTKAAERLRALLPHATVELWPDWRHSVTDADRARIVETILAHTGRVGSPRPDRAPGDA